MSSKKDRMQLFNQQKTHRGSNYTGIKQMLINKIEENEDQQGFIKAKQQISIDYRCFSYSVPKQSKFNPFTKRVKGPKLKIESIQNIKNSPFINQSVREYTYKEVIKQQRENIIFNGFNNEVGQPEPNITFNASFPMSNLEVVTRVKNCHYDIYMRPDTNTNTHFQWFYFRVNIIKKKRVKFTIKNFIKATMLYSKGLKPFYKSKQQESSKFTQISEQVQFVEDLDSDFYSLSFYFNFQHNNDSVEFASQPPYGFQRLDKTLQQLDNVKRYTIGKTILGNRIPYLIFNQKIDPQVIGVAIARQHPGETVGSWMMDGFLREINRNNFSKDIQWIIIPMVNIDGVELGNNRTGVLGHDFNRNWDIDEGSKKQKMFPQVASILNYIRKLKKKYPKKIKMFLDLHGHSSQQNVFAYGPQHMERSEYFYMSRLFPQLISRKNDNFKLSQSSYKINNDKKNASRSIILNQFKIPFTYTIECTFGVMNDMPVDEDAIIKVGQDIALAANQFLQNLYLKDFQANGKTMIDEVKRKYLEQKHEAEEYDSASEASQDTPGRKQFQMNIQSLLEDGKTTKRSSLIKLQNLQSLNPKIDYDKSKRKNSEETLGFKSKSFLNDEILKSVQNVKTKRRSNRVATEGCNPQIYNECAYFPPVKNRYNFGRVPVSDKFPVLGKQTQDIPEMMNMKQIQQRLFKMKNSRIGKKILVINAYGV